MEALFAGKVIQYRPHEEIIATISEASATFKILIVKTSLRIPYTSVFLRLGCGYWTEDQDRRLRQDQKIDAPFALPV